MLDNARRWPARVLPIAFIFLCTCGDEAKSQQYWNTNGTAASITALNWSAFPGGPFTDAYAGGTGIIFGANSTVNFVTNTVVGNVTVQDGFNVLLVPSGTYGTGGTVRTLDIGNGSIYDLGAQSISTATGTGFIKNGNGILFTQGNAYNGGFTLNGGIVVIGGVNAMGSGTGSVLNINGGRLTANAERLITARYTLGINVGGNFTIGGTTTGVRSGNALSTANILFGDAVNLGAANRTITIGGIGTYTFTGSVTGSGGLTTDATTGGNLVLSGVNSYSGGLTVINGSVVLSPTVPNTYSGNTAVNGGVLTFLNTNAKPVGDTTTVGPAGTLALGIGTGAFALTDMDSLLANTFAGTTLDSASGVGISTAADLTYATNISGARSFTKLGAGGLTLSGTNSYTGTTTLYGGNFVLSTPEDPGLSGPFGVPAVPANSIILNGGTIQYTVVPTVDYSTRFSNASDQRYNVDTNGQTITWATPLTSTGGTVTKRGNGVLFLTGASTFSAATNVFGGSVVIDNVNAVVGSLAVPTQNNLSSGVLNGAPVALRLLNGTFNMGGTGSAAPQMVVGASGAAASYGALEIVNGTLNLSTEMLYPAGVTSNATRFGTRRGIIYQSGGAMNLTYNGPGIGTINFNGGELNVGSGTERGIVYASGGTTTISTGTQTGFGASIGVTTTAGNAAGSDLTITGTASWSLTGTAGFIQITRLAEVATGNLNINNGGQLTTRGIVKGSSSTTSIARINIDGGTLRAGASNADFLENSATLGITTTRIYAGGATFDTPAGNNITIATPLLAPTGQIISGIDLGSGGSEYVGPPIISITGGGGTGASAVALMSYGVNGLGTVTGYSITSGGSDYNPLTPPTVTVLYGFQSTGTPATIGAINFAPAPTTGGITKSGPANLTISGANTYGGVTAVREGTLFINGNNSAAAGAVVVGGAQATGTPTLGGIGTVGGAVIISTAGGGAAGTLAPGITTGMLTVASNVTFESGSTFRWDIGAHTALGDTATVTNGFSDLVATKDLLAITGGNSIIANSPSATFNLVQLGTVVLDSTKYYSFTVSTSTGTPVLTGFAPLTASGLLANAPDFSAYVTAGGSANLVADSGNVYLNLTAAPVPEPGTILGLAAGLLGLGRWMRNPRKVSAA